MTLRILKMENNVVHLVRGSKFGMMFNKVGPPSVIPLPDVISDATLARTREFITAAAKQGLTGFPPVETIQFKDYAEGTQL
jgi:hypothetical protein